jgi:hypothetical protein
LPNLLPLGLALPNLKVSYSFLLFWERDWG